MKIEVLSALPLDRLGEHEGATWLDRQLSGESVPLRDSGFGKQVRTALLIRQQWLVAEGLGEEGDGGFELRLGALSDLRRRELARTAAQLSDTLGLAYLPANEGERVAGILSRRVDLASGRFVLIGSGREFTLVPWRPVLEPHIGRHVSGVVHDGDVSWTIHRSRGIEI